MMKATKTFRTSLSVIAAAAILALFAAPKEALAGTLTVPAPKETASVHLGVKDPPANAFLEGWYCSKTPLKKTIADMMVAVDVGLQIDLQEGVTRAVNWESKFLEKGWPFKLAGMQKSPTKKGLDAPPGGTKVYKFKYCYTADELQTVHDKLKQWLDSIWKGTLLGGEGVDRELHIKYYGLPENYR